MSQKKQGKAEKDVAENPDDELRPNQRIAIAALMRGANASEAGREAGVQGQQVQRWLKQQPFRKALAAESNASIAAAARALADAGMVAVETLREICARATDAPSTRVRAAEAILSHMQKLNFPELEQRVTELEAVILRETHEHPN